MKPSRNAPRLTLDLGLANSDIQTHTNTNAHSSIRSSSRIHIDTGVGQVESHASSQGQNYGQRISVKLPERDLRVAVSGTGESHRAYELPNQNRWWERVNLKPKKTFACPNSTNGKKENRFAASPVDNQNIFSVYAVDPPTQSETDMHTYTYDERKIKRLKSKEDAWEHQFAHPIFGRESKRDCLNFECGVYASKGPRPDMEDRYCLVGHLGGNKHMSYFGVFDGHGGDSAAEFCMRELDSVLCDVMKRYGIGGLLLNPVEGDTPPLPSPLSAHMVDESDASNSCTSDGEYGAPNSGENKTPTKCAIDANSDERFKKALIEAFEGADEQYRTTDPRQIQGRDRLTGSTAITLVTANKSLHLANVGDSRAVLVHSDGSFTQMSRDHKPDCREERERIINAGGSVTEDNRLEGIFNLSRAIGDSELKQYLIATPEVISHALTERDMYIILGTDGLWNYVSNERVARIALDGRCVHRIAKQLVTEAQNSHSSEKGNDNITAMVINLKEYYVV